LATNTIYIKDTHVALNCFQWVEDIITFIYALVCKANVH